MPLMGRGPASQLLLQGRRPELRARDRLEEQRPRPRSAAQGRSRGGV